MQPGKFITIFQKLTAKEQKSFRTFLQSPYPTNEPQLLILFDLLLKTQSDHPDIRQKLWTSLYQDPKKEYRDDHMRKLLSDLAKRVELFLSLEAFLADNLLSGPVLLHALNSRGLDKYFQQKLRSMQKKLDQQEVYHSPLDLHALIRIGWEDYEHRLSRGRHEGNLREVMDNLDLYYVLQGLKFLTENWSIHFVIPAVERMNSNERVLLMAREAPFCDHPVVAIYLAILDLFLSLQEGEAALSDFLNVHQVLNEQVDSIERDEAGYLYTFVINHGLRMVNKSSGKAQMRYLKIMADIQASVIEKKILHVHGYLPHELFKNFMTNILKSGDFERAQKVLEELPLEIKPDHREQAVVYNTAACFFYMQDYSRTLRFLQQSSLDDEFYALDSRSMLMITLLEQREYEVLRFNLNSHERYLARNKRLGSPRKRRHLNRVKLMRRLLRAVDKPELSKTKLLTLQKKVADEPELIGRDYLLRKIDQFLAEA